MTTNRTNHGAAADLLLYNATVVTVDRECPRAELVAVRGNRVVGVGGGDTIERYRGPRTRLIDCEGRAVVPGFNDAHCHPLALASTLLYVDCSPTVVKSIAELQSRIRGEAQRTPRGRWLRAANYDESALVEGRHPTRRELDEASPHHPVILVHHTGYHCVLNSRALEAAGVTAETADPAGGVIHRHPETGEPDGLISGRNALVEQAVPPLGEDELERGLGLACEKYLSTGVTSVQDTTWSNGPDQWQRWQRFVGRGSMSLRLCMFAGAEALEGFQSAGLSFGSGDSRLRLGGVKLALDESTGSPHPPQEDITYHALRAHEAGFPVAFHVSDVYMLQASLSAIELLKERFPGAGHRHRLEHCAVCPPDFVPRLAASGAMVVTQPAFLYYYGGRYLDGAPADDLASLYPLRSFLERQVKVAASSDSPMVPCNPMTGICAAVTRREEMRRALCPAESVSPEEALSMYTIGGAGASFEEQDKGSITPGKLADLVVLSDDPTQAAPEAIKAIRAMLTILDGQVVWEG